MATAAREHVVRAVAELPEAAFLLVCGLLWNAAPCGDGLSSDSRVALRALQVAVRRYLETVTQTRDRE